MCSDVDSRVFDYVVFEWLHVHVSMSLLEIPRTDGHKFNCSDLEQPWSNSNISAFYDH